jgi:hypothetical protein
MNKVIWLGMAIVAAGSMAWAEDGKKIVNLEGSCQVAVPANWDVGSTECYGNPPDKKATVAVSSPRRTTNFDSLKQTARDIYKSDKVTRNSASGFQMEGESIAGGKFCIKDRGECEAREITLLNRDGLNRNRDRRARRVTDRHIQGSSSR